MQTDKESQRLISEAALKVFSREELQQMSRPSLNSFLHLIEKRLNKPGAQPPTLDELEGIKELVVEHLSHPALGALSRALPTSPQEKSATSASASPTDQPSAEPSDEPTPPTK